MWGMDEQTEAGLSEIKPERKMRGLVMNSIFVLKLIIVIYEI
jgi:hypothetical protein